MSILCIVLVLSRPAFLTYLDNKCFDRLVSGTQRHPASNQVIVVDIDELSLAKVGRWPWPRDVMARLIRRLDDAKAALIAVDMVFAEPDPVPSKDEAFAAALGQGRSLLGFDFVFDWNANRATSCAQPPKPLAAATVLPSSQAGILLPEASAIICDIPVFESKTARSGFLNSFRDHDGVVRRTPLLLAYRGAIYPSLALAAVAGAENDSVELMQGSHQALLRWRGKPIKLSDGSDLLLRYRGPNQALPHSSAAQVLNGNFATDAFAGRIAVVGSSANGLETTLETLFDRSYVGVEVQATAIDNLIAGDYFYHPGWSNLPEVASILVVTFLSAWLLFRFPAIAGVFSALFIATSVWVVSQALMDLRGMFISPLPAICACMGTVAVSAGRIVFTEGRSHRQSLEEIAVANRFITGALGAMTAVRDVETGQHVVRIQRYLESLCRVVAAKPRFSSYLTPPMIDLLVQLAPIHDIGKVGVPDYILRKPGALTNDEFEQMKSHVTLGKRILEEAREQSGLRNEVFFQTAKDIVYSHHERWDGTGYPLGLKGDAIPIPGRLLAVADVYDALISKRHYKAEILHAEAVERIRLGAGSHFDPEIVEGFLAVQGDWRRMAEAHRDEPGMAATT